MVVNYGKRKSLTLKYLYQKKNQGELLVHFSSILPGSVPQGNLERMKLRQCDNRNHSNISKILSSLSVFLSFAKRLTDTLLKIYNF